MTGRSVLSKNETFEFKFFNLAFTDNVVIRKHAGIIAKHKGHLGIRKLIAGVYILRLPFPVVWVSIPLHYHTFSTFRITSVPVCKWRIGWVKNYGLSYLGRNMVMTLNQRFGCCHLGRKSKLICHCLYPAYWMWHNAGLRQPSFCDLRTVEGSQICKRASWAHKCLLGISGRRYYYAL